MAETRPHWTQDRNIGCLAACLVFLVLPAVALVAFCGRGAPVGPDLTAKARADAALIAVAAARSRGPDSTHCPSALTLQHNQELSGFDAIIDPWASDFAVSCEGLLVTVTSPGPDKRLGNSDDIRVVQKVSAKPSASKAGPEPMLPDTLGETLPSGVVATDTAASIRRFHPAACRAASATESWGACHDTTKGFESVLRCAKAARASARASKSQIPSSAAQSACGREVANVTRDMVSGTVKLLDDVVAWLEKNREALAPALTKGPLSDACDEVNCDAKPSESADAYKSASYAQIQGIECTKVVFRCGPASDNVCWLSKVAARLAVACDPAENKNSDGLFVRATGVRVR